MYIFLFIPTCKHFCKLFPILDFISTLHSWDNVSVPLGNFISVSSPFMRTWCGGDYPEISGSHLGQGWSCLSQPTWEAQLSLSWLFRTAQFLRYTNAQLHLLSISDNSALKHISHQICFDSHIQVCYWANTLWQHNTQKHIVQAIKELWKLSEEKLWEKDPQIMYILQNWRRLCLLVRYLKLKMQTG